MHVPHTLNWQNCKCSLVSGVVFTLRPPTGISSETILKHTNISEEELLDLIDKLNTDPRVDGLLVQLPLPGTAKLGNPALGVGFAYVCVVSRNPV